MPPPPPAVPPAAGGAGVPATTRLPTGWSGRLHAVEGRDCGHESNPSDSASSSLSVANPKEATHQRGRRKGEMSQHPKEATRQREGCRERAQGSGSCWRGAGRRSQEGVGGSEGCKKARRARGTALVWSSVGAGLTQA
eukprot:2944663-Prymnesium_polylepis.2